MQMDLKSNHHYVYKDYLNGWAVDGVKKGVFYLTKKRVVARDSAAGLFVEKDFYKFSPISKEDLSIFDSFISAFGERHQESSRRMISELYELSKIHSILSRSEQSAEIERAIRFIEKNTLEDRHCAIENAVRPILKKLWVGDFNAVDSPEDCAMLAYYLGGADSKK
jgi:hypothetical protein